MRKIFYDFEVFKENWMLVIIDYDTKKGKVIVDDEDLLRKYYTLFKDDVWIGYNSRGYDQYILKGILLGYDPYYINEQIINNGKKGHEVVKQGWKIPLNNFDISTGFHSLKQLEGFMGSKIKESSVPFDIDRPLTQEEIKEVIAYCTHDVKETINVFDNLIEEFESQLALIEAFNLEMKQFTKTKAQLSAHIIGAEKQPDRGDEFKLSFPDTLVVNKYQHIVDWYKSPENMDYNKNLKVDVAGVPHIFAWGGIHGAIPKYKDEGIILCADVASLYPSLMIEYGYISRNVKNPYKFKEIRDKRLELKKKKDPRQLPMKIVINANYGAMKDQYNPLYDPLMSNNVCLAGQLFLLDLIEKLEPYCKLIQSNTDGVFLKVEKEDDIPKIKSVASEWEKRTRLDLEWERFDRIYQKDVNNYIIINNDGKYKSKGSYVKKLNNLDYDLPIVNAALVNYFVQGTSIEETITNCNDLRDFQKIVKLSSAYKNAYKNCTFSKKKVLNEETGRNRTVTSWDENGEILEDKTFRVFASLREDDGGIFKRKEGKNPEKFANTPDKCFINNDDIKGIKVPEYLDKQYYVDLAHKRLSDFLETKDKKKKEKIEK